MFNVVGREAGWWWAGGNQLAFALMLLTSAAPGKAGSTGGTSC
jgi:hypothetical protein